MPHREPGECFTVADKVPGDAQGDGSDGEPAGDRLATAVARTAAALDGVAAARSELAAVRARVARGADVLDFWEEGLDLAGFYGRFALAALRDEVDARRRALLDELETLRARTRDLWARTDTPGSIQRELDARYGFHEAYLGAAGPDVLRRIAGPVQPPFHLAVPDERPFGSVGAYG